MSCCQEDHKLIFFLGAGASIPAGVNGMVALANDFTNYLEKSNKIDDLNVVNNIKLQLEKWITENNMRRKVDIELIMETIDKIENVKNEILLNFCINPELNIKGLKQDSQLSKDLKLFILDKCFILQSNTAYLKHLIRFFEDQNQINVFSTNYDNCIEQFCDKFNLQCKDKVIPLLSDQTHSDKVINLYKLHGSITWWKNEQGDIFNSQIKVNSHKAQTAGGTSAVPIILYPGKKIDYSDPFLNTFMKLKEYIEKVNYIVVIGYSFFDTHLKKLFQIGARKNRKLIVILVRPSAESVYERLKYIENEEIKKSFSDSFNGESFTAPIPSNLKGRVITLPYEIQDILPFLKEQYLQNLIQAENLESSIGIDGFNKNIETWKKCMKHYTDCEFLEKVDKMFDEIDFQKESIKDWKFYLGITLKGSMSLIIGDSDIESVNSEKKIMKEKWKQRLNSLCQLFSSEKLKFIITLQTHTASFSPSLLLKFDTNIQDLNPINLREYLENFMMVELDNKLIISKKEEIALFKENIQDIINFFIFWSQPTEVSFENYYSSRKEYPNELEELKKRIKNYSTTNKVESIEAMIQNIEGQILKPLIQKILL